MVRRARPWIPLVLGATRATLLVAYDELVSPEVLAGVATRLPGTVGGCVSADCVVPEALADCAEQLPAASHAETVKLYVVPGLRPWTAAPVALTLPSNVPPA